MTRHPDYEPSATAEEIEAQEVEIIAKLKACGSDWGRRAAARRRQLLADCRSRGFAAVYARRPQRAPDPSPQQHTLHHRDGVEHVDFVQFRVAMRAARRLKDRHALMSLRSMPLEHRREARQPTPRRGHAPHVGSNRRTRGSRRVTATARSPGGDDPPPESDDPDPEPLARDGMSPRAVELAAQLQAASDALIASWRAEWGHEQLALDGGSG
jgi:hypothetical protein